MELCKEMAKYGIFENVSKQMANLGESMEALLISILDRVENEVGSDVVKYLAMLLISSGAYGLTETRLLKLFDQKSISNSKMKLSVLINGLETFLQDTNGTDLEGTVILKQGTPSEILVSKICTTRDINEGHKILANLYLDETEHELFILESIPYHLSALNDVKQLIMVLCSLDYLQKCAQAESLLINVQARGPCPFFKKCKQTAVDFLRTLFTRVDLKISILDRYLLSR